MINKFYLLPAVFIFVIGCGELSEKEIVEVQKIVEEDPSKEAEEEKDYFFSCKDKCYGERYYFLNQGKYHQFEQGKNSLIISMVGGMGPTKMFGDASEFPNYVEYDIYTGEVISHNYEVDDIVQVDESSMYTLDFLKSLSYECEGDDLEFICEMPGDDLARMNFKKFIDKAELKERAY